MDAIEHWLTSQLGIPTWVVGSFVLPLLVVLLIFGLRELVLAIASHFAGERDDLGGDAGPGGSRFC